MLGIIILSISVLLISIIVFNYLPNIVINNIVSIITCIGIIFASLTYYDQVVKDQEDRIIRNRDDYINNIGNIFIKIDGYYIEYPDKLQDLFYEFYGYNNFPKEDNNKSEEVTGFEYIIIIMIIENINIIYSVRQNFYDNLYL